MSLPPINVFASGGGASVALPSQSDIELGLDCPSNGSPRFDASKLNGWFNLLTTDLNTAIAAINDTQATTITPQGLAVGGGDLTANRIINVPIATQAETQAMLDNTKAVTPFALKQLIDAIYSQVINLPPESLNSFLEFANAIKNDPNFGDSIIGQIANEAVARANGDTILSGLITTGDTALQNQVSSLQAVTITGQGLAIGGGNLTANRTITVQAATQQEAIDGLRNDVALTPLAQKAASDALYISIVGAAPAAINTLAEVANAFNDDPNFAATINGQLANEALARANADTALANAIASEATARTNGDANLQAQIDALTTQLNALLAQTTLQGAV
jgi:hypothetical protein